MIDSLRNVVRLNVEATQRLMEIMAEGSVPPSSNSDKQNGESLHKEFKEERMAQFFRYDHLPSELQDVSRVFCQLAEIVIQTLPMNPERTVCLRKLLESKDCAVRALIYKG